MATAGSTGVSGVKRKRKSLSWEFFNKLTEDTAECDICGDKVKTSGNTSNLFKVISCSLSLLQYWVEIQIAILLL